MLDTAAIRDNESDYLALCDELDALRAKIAKLRELAVRPGDPCCLRLIRDMLAILDEVNNAAI